MYHVEIYVRVRRACMVEGMSVREASRVFGLHRDTVRKMLAYSAPPGYRRQDPPRRPRLEPFTGVIDAILEADRQVPRKQRRWNELPRKRDLRLSGQIWGDPHENRAAAHSASTVHPIHDVQPMMSSRITGVQTHRPGPRRF